MNAVDLNEAALPLLPEDVEVPSYPRGEVGVGIVHIGVGGFHRAHEAQYVDQVLALPGQHQWGIAGVGLLPGDRRMAEVLDAQDHLYTLVTRTPSGEDTARVIGSLQNYVLALDDPAAALALMVRPGTSIVSLTITEGGYPVGAHGEFDASDPALAEDISRTDGAPRTAFGLIIEALRQRRAAGLPPFTVMSCDNIQGNGDFARTAVVGFARARDAELAEWIEANGAFPNSMVDRITPVTTDAGRDFVASTFGIRDGWPVISESFTQWVLEDSFVDGRPPFERVGVQLVEDVRPYEAMKLRLLNATHQAVSYLGLLHGYEYVHEAVTDPVFAEFLMGYMTQEASPTLPVLPGVDLPRYRQDALERFGNPAIADTLARQVVDGTDRISKFVMPVLADRLQADESVEHIALVLAAWSEYVRVTVAAGGAEALTDSRRDEVIPAVLSQSPEGTELLKMSLFGPLGEDERLIDAYRRARIRLSDLGPMGAMQALAATHDREA